MAGTFFNSQLYLLRVDVSSFWKTEKASSNDAYFFLIGIVVIIGALIIINFLKKRSPGKRRPVLSSSAGTGSGQKHFSGFALYRAVSGIGLDRDQTKMLDYVLKTDDVVDVEKSVNSPALLDRHFKRAYQKIERTAGSEEEAQQRLALLFSTRNVLENTSGNNISSTLQLPENITAILNVGKEKHPVKVISAKSDALNVECPQNTLGTAIKLPKGSNLNIVVFTKNNKGFSFSSRVLGSSTTHGVQVLHLAHSKQLKQLSQRRFRRRQAAIPTNFFFVYAESGGKRLVVDKRRLTGSIMDISAGGCSIKTTMQVSGGAKLKIEFVEGDVSVAALGQVLRTNRSGINTIIHIKFLKVPRKSMNTINAFVYEYGDE
ncbi:MAG: PilZ domain-containing protein [Treponema sp.]|jgi:c-di-GMP-binding flagellar brake protein YcgR|nr:PilZ domain-containing protein [Treponema sp.]